MKARSDIILKFKLIHFCKARLIKNNILNINGRYVKLCKHKEILETYKLSFGTNPEEDFQKQKEIIDANGEGYIYVIGNLQHNICKIGYSTNVFKRIKQVQTGCLIPLEIICVVRGDIRTERQLHKKYAHLKTIGEWFIYADDLKASVSKTKNIFDEIVLKPKKARKQNIINIRNEGQSSLTG